MLEGQKLTRRHFIGTTAGAMGAAIVVPYLIPQCAFGANDRVLTGHIGVGGQGRSDMKIGYPIAVCDVDKKRAGQAAESVGKNKSRKCDLFGDFRKLLDRKDIDAVVIATPDHWHALTTVLACEAGKDVYCEKPLTLTIAEGRAMVNAARKHNRIVQTGSQQRSSANFRHACELVRNGRIGKIIKVEVGIPACNHPGALGPDSDPPEWLDYDFWLGPAAWRPYNEKRVHYNFRFWLDYSGGQMTNWGAHHIDIAQWGLGMDDSGPISTEGTAEFDSQKRFTVPATYDLLHTYANGVKLHVGQKYKGGTTFFGEKGMIHVNRGTISSTPAEILKEEIGPQEIHLYESGSHGSNWLECIKTRKLPICDVEIGHRTATVCHLGNICALLGGKLQWDPSKEQFVGNEKASAMIGRSYRAPWKL